MLPRPALRPGQRHPLGDAAARLPLVQTLRRRLKRWLERDAFRTAWRGLAKRYERLDGIKGYCQELCLEDSQAAGFSGMPSMKTVPLMTSASSGEPFKDRQLFDADSISLETIARPAARLPF